MKTLVATLIFTLLMCVLINAQTTTSAYTFSYEVLTEISSSKDNKTYKMSYLLNPKKRYVGMKADMSAYANQDMQGESIIIMDDGQARIFVETQGMKMQMSQSMMGGIQDQNLTEQMANYDYNKIKKTGRTKIILDTLCEEYVMSDDDVKMELWVAPDIDLPNWFVQNRDLIKGHIMAYTITSKEGNMTSTTIAIKKNISTTINPQDYKKMF